MPAIEQGTGAVTSAAISATEGYQSAATAGNRIFNSIRMGKAMRAAETQKNTDAIIAMWGDATVTRENNSRQLIGKINY